MKVTVIGAGNMSTALVFGIINQGILGAEDISVSDLDIAKLDEMKSKGVCTFSSNVEAVKGADVIILAVKPTIYPIVLKELSQLEEIKNSIIVSITPGITIQSMKEQLGYNAKIIRTMPNTPAMVGEGMTILCYQEPVSAENYQVVNQLFEAVGKTQLLDEKLLNQVVSVSGSSPAYIYMLIEAMADGAVYGGIPRDIAYQLVAQSVLGSAKMVLETGKHPAQLKDMVCSPAGTTISAVQVLEEEGFRSAIIKAMLACNQKSEELSQ